jgi:hypothetical protein
MFRLWPVVAAMYSGVWLLLFVLVGLSFRMSRPFLLLRACDCNLDASSS